MKTTTRINGVQKMQLYEIFQLKEAIKEAEEKLKAAYMNALPGDKLTLEITIMKEGI